MNLLSTPDAEFEWAFDPAASGGRFRAFTVEYELCAYEDGRWYVANAGRVFASGDVGGGDRLEIAKETTLKIFRLHVKYSGAALSRRGVA